jgi:hypothetical protein
MTEHHLKVGYNSQLLGLNYESLTTRRIIILCFSLHHSKLGFVKQMKWALLEKIELVTQSIEVGFTVCNIFKWGLCAGKSFVCSDGLLAETTGVTLLQAC